jgi:hypothetical protein
MAVYCKRVVYLRTTRSISEDFSGANKERITSLSVF